MMKGPTWHRIVALAVVLIAPVASAVIVLAPAELPPGSKVVPGGMRPVPAGVHPSWLPPLPLAPASPGGAAEPAFLGVLTGPATPRIHGVMPGSPAAEAGLQPGDVILAVGGRPVRRGAELHDRIRRYRAGDEVSLRIARQGRPLELRVRLGARPPAE
jgi:S1-C subfamily serine protease